MEIISFDTREEAEAKLNSLELGEIEEAPWSGHDSFGHGNAYAVHASIHAD